MSENPRPEEEPSSNEPNLEDEDSEREEAESEQEPSPESGESLSDVLRERQKEQEEEILEEMRASLDKDTKESIQNTFQDEINRLKKKFIKEHEFADEGEIKREPAEILEELRNSEEYQQEREEIEKLEVMQSFFKAEENPSYENQFVALDTLNKIAEKMGESGERDEAEEARFKEILELRETIAENILPDYEREEEREEESEEVIENKRKEIIIKEIQEKVNEELVEKWNSDRDYYGDFEDFKNREIGRVMGRACDVLDVDRDDAGEALLYLLDNEDVSTLEDIQSMNEKKEEEYPGGKLTSWLIKPLEKAGEWVGDKLHDVGLYEDWVPKEEREKTVRLKDGVIEVDNEKFRDELEEFKKNRRETSEIYNDEAVKKELEKDQKKERHEELIELGLNEEIVREKYEEIKEKLIGDYTAESEEESSEENTESEETEENFDEDGAWFERICEDIENGNTPELGGNEEDKDKIKDFFIEHGFQSENIDEKIEGIVRDSDYKDKLRDEGKKAVFEWILTALIIE